MNPETIIRHAILDLPEGCQNDHHVWDSYFYQPLEHRKLTKMIWCNKQYICRFCHKRILQKDVGSNNTAYST